ncbi:MAG: TetR family transcriptional regulator [Bacteroidales bacterium]|nr:TetR family transcriptional regulator [Bacteroidales bacterium]
MTEAEITARTDTSEKWQRARKPDQRNLRRQEILQSAYRLFRDEDFSGISLNSIAREAELSKTSIYLYFKTKEEIFLYIYMQACQNMIDAMVAGLVRLPQNPGCMDIAEVCVSALWNDEKMCSLSPLVNASIERNVSDTLLAEVVRLKMNESKKLHQAMKRFLPNLSEKNAYEFLLYTINLFSQFIANEKNKQLLCVLGNEEFSGKNINIRELFIDGVSRLIYSYGFKCAGLQTDVGFK